MKKTIQCLAVAALAGFSVATYANEDTTSVQQEEIKFPAVEKSYLKQVQRY